MYPPSILLSITVGLFFYHPIKLYERQLRFPQTQMSAVMMLYALRGFHHVLIYVTASVIVYLATGALRSQMADIYCE